MHRLGGSECSFLVIFVSLLEHVQTHDTGNGRLHEEEEEEGALHSFFAEGAKDVHLWAATDMFKGDAWIFAAPDPAVASIVKVSLKHPVFILGRYMDLILKR
jgi:hypothetical protein